jgi:argininosuccinate lyase
MSEATNWVTVKLPEETRDKAQKDPRTYGEVMEDGLQVSLSADSEDAESVVQELEARIDSLAFDGAISEDEAQQMLSSLQTLEKRTGKIERQLEELR